MTEINNNKAKKTGQITIELDGLSYRLDEMGKKIKILEGVLDPILGLESPLKEEEIKTPPICPIATSINQLSRNVESMNTRLDNITNRIEL